ncbi:Bromodomain-containing protein [Melampsora americana]|nr:Bromodomain-containing protein [Melampsora americana]
MGNDSSQPNLSSSLPPTRIRLIQPNLKRNHSPPPTNNHTNITSKKLTLRLRPPPPPPTSVSASTTHEDLSFHSTALALWNTLVNTSDQDGRLRSIAFMDLPSATEYPDYYQWIKRPLSLNQIKQKLDQLAYPTQDKFIADMRLVFNNAKKYNVEDSLIYDDARTLLKILKRELRQLTSTEPQPQSNGDEEAQNSDSEPKQKKIKLKIKTPVTGRQSTPPAAPKAVNLPVSNGSLSGSTPPVNNRSVPVRPSPQEALKSSTRNNSTHSPKPSISTSSRRDLTLKAWIKTRLKALEEVRDAQSGRQLMEEFQTLPDKSVWKEYYAVIPSPIAFENVRGKNDKRAYKDLESFKADVQLIFKNAQHFNEDGSIVWKDSKVLEQKFADLIKDAPAEFPEPVLRGPYKKTQERQSQQAAVTKEKNTPAPQSATPSKPLAVPNSIPPAIAGRVSPRLNPVALPAPVAIPPAVPNGISIPQQPTLLSQIANSLPKAVPVPSIPSRASSPVPVVDRVLRSASRSPSRQPTPSIIPPARVPSPLRPPSLPIIPPSIPSMARHLPASVPVRPLSRLAHEISPALMHIEQPPPLSQAQTRVMVKIPNETDGSLINSFKLITIPATTLEIEMKNNYVRQHAIHLPASTKAIRVSVVSSKLNGETSFRCRGSTTGRIVRDPNDRFLVEIWEGLNIIEIEAESVTNRSKEKELYRIFVHK